MYGHNVNGIAQPDSSRFSTVPGSTTPYFHLECAGTYGCHGDRSVGRYLDNPLFAMKGAHHNNDNTTWKDGTSIARSYRFLNGIQGYGTPRYEFQASLSLNDHNRYFGKVRKVATETAAPDFEANSDNGTISGFCALCHEDFHNGNNSVGNFGSGVWIRHPTDYDMSDSISSTEYQNYNLTAPASPGPRNYSLVAPLATTQKENSAQSLVLTGTGQDAIVTCISCHRAHGSRWPAAMRWNYRGWPGSTGYDGCSICHTTKD